MDYRRIVVEAIEDSLKKFGVADTPAVRIKILTEAHEHLIIKHKPNHVLNQFLLAIENEVAFLQHGQTPWPR